MVQPCPVCRLGVTDLPAHLELHTKQEVVFALVTQHQRGGTTEGPPCHGRPAAAAALGKQPSAPSLLQASASSTAAGSLQPRAAPPPPPPSSNSLHIRKTLNNVNIVNNITAAARAPDGGSFLRPAAGNSTAAGSLVIPGVSGAAAATAVHHHHHHMMSGPLSLLCTSAGGAGEGVLPLNLITTGLAASTQLLLPQMNGPTLLVNVPNNYVAYQQQVATTTNTGAAALVFPTGGRIFATTGFGNFAMVPSSSHHHLNHHRLVQSTPAVVSRSSSAAVSGTAAVSCSSSSSGAPLPQQPALGRKVPAASSSVVRISPAPLPTTASFHSPAIKPELAPTQWPQESPGLDATDEQEEEAEKIISVANQLMDGDTTEESTETDGAAMWSVRALSGRLSHQRLTNLRPLSEAEMSAVTVRHSDPLTVELPARHRSVISWPDMGGPPPAAAAASSCSSSASSSQTALRRRDEPVLVSAGNHQLQPPNRFFSRLLPTGADSSEERVVDSGAGGAIGNGIRPTASSVIVSPGGGGGGGGTSFVEPLHTTTVSQEPLTVDTVEALRSALASDVDVQLVISNNLLDTPEFRSLMLNLEQEDSGTRPTGLLSGGSEVLQIQEEEEEEEYSSSSSSSYSLSHLARYYHHQSLEEEESQDGAGPSLSTISTLPHTRSSCNSILSSVVSTSENSMADSIVDDEDMTLQDLIAVETIDESQMPDDDDDDGLGRPPDEDESSTGSKDDLSWTNQLSLDSFQYISHVLRYGGPFRCEKCGLQYGSLDGYKEHRSRCSTSVDRKQEGSAAGCCKGEASGRIADVKTKPEDEEKMEVLVKLQEDSKLLPGSSSLAVFRQAEAALASGTIVVKSEPTVASQDLLAATGRSWKCGQCRALFPTGAELVQHLEVLRLAEVKCTKCHTLFTHHRDLVEHMNTAHKDKVSNQQSVEGKANPVRIKKPQAKKDPDQKIFSYNKDGEVMCEVCDRAFKEPDQLMSHMACHVEAKPFECLTCGKRFHKAGLMREHQKRHLEVGAFACSMCEKRFYSPTKLKEHIRTHTGETPLICDICGKGFKRYSNLTEHRRVHVLVKVERPPKELFCHCGKMFHTTRDLEWHVEGEHERRPKKCNFCGDVFVHSTSLTRHIRLKHESDYLPGGKKVSLYGNCPLCDQVFYKTSINKHIRVVHQGVKSFVCEICKKSFVAKCNLDNHMWQHKNQRLRPFKCKLCSKAYLRENLLKQHMRSHQGVKPFVCNECGAQFSMKNNFKRHVAEHTGQRKFVCPECNKTFTRSYYLTDHMKVHSGEKPYVCNICGKTAATRSNYNSHLKTHVTREPVNSEV